MGDSCSYGKNIQKSFNFKNSRTAFLLATSYPEWLFAESYDHVGDTGETLSLLAHSLNLCRETSSKKNISLAEWMEKEILALAQMEDEVEQSKHLLKWWKNLTYQEVSCPQPTLITGAFRVGSVNVW